MIRLLRAGRRVTQVLHYLSAFVAVPLMILLVIYDVFLRYVLLDPSLWANEVTAVLLILVIFATLPHVTIRRDHLSNDLIYLMLGDKGKRVTAGAGYLCGMVFGGTLAYRSFTAMLDAQRYGEGTQNVDFPYWPFYTVMAISAALIALISFLQIVAALIGSHEDPDPAHEDGTWS